MPDRLTAGLPTVEGRKPFDMLRLVLEELTRRKLPPTPGHYTATYRRLDTADGGTSDAITQSELQLCAHLVDVLQGLYANGGWLHTQIGQLRVALEDERKPLDQRITLVETVIRNIALNKARAVSEMHDFSADLKLTIATVHNEVRASLGQVQDSGAQMQDFQTRMDTCNSLDEAHSLLAECANQVNALATALDRTGQTLLATRNFLETTTRRLEEAEARGTESPGTSDHDALTGTLDRSGLEHAIAHCPVGDTCVLVLDIDGLARINDQHGRPVGDLVLQGAARTLRKTLRDSDLLARIEEDTFVIVLPGMRLTRANLIAERLLDTLRNWRHSETARRYGLNLTASGGMSACLLGNGEVGEVLRMALEVAERHLFEAKRAGGNRILPA